MALENQSAPVLSLAQQKKSIAGLKVQKRKVVHTLDSPLDIQWPRIGFERENEVKMMLTEHLSAIRSKNVSISRKTLFTIPRKERAEWRKAERAKIQQTFPINKDRMSHCLVGMKDVLKAIAKNRVCIVLCEGYPTQTKSMLTKLLIPLCKKHSIPLLPLKNFMSTLTNLLNVPNCLAIALETGVKEPDSPLHQLYLKLECICNRCGLITAHYDKLGNEEITKKEIHEEKEEKEEKRSMEVEPETIDCERFYLKKPAQGRCFTPGNGNPFEEEAKISSKATGFISLANISAPEPVTSSPRYHTTMRIKRLLPNANKVVSKNMKKQ